jgi:hypothetical protein
MSRNLSSRVFPALFFVLVLSTGLVDSARAAAEPGQMQFGFRTGNGYRIIVEGHRSTVGLSVIRSEHDRHDGAATTYFARAILGTRRIRASFGALGSVSMHFEPSGRVVQAQPERGCTGVGGATTHLGVFIGSLRFRGEGGYVSASIHRAKGGLSSPPKPNCAGSNETGGEGEVSRRAKRTELSAGFRRGLGAVYFGASARGNRARYYAIAEQGEGQIGIYRVAYATTSPLTFATDGALSFASLSPPYPFSGTGSLQRNLNGSRTWTGSLAVTFPGDPNVALDGPDFRTRLTRSW